MNLTQFNNRLKVAPRFIRDATFDIVKDQENMIIELNQTRIYETGTGADGNTLGEYRPVTIQIKEMNLPGHDSRTENITLKDTGGFYEGMYLQEKLVDTFALQSTSETYPKIMRRPEFRQATGLTEKEAEQVSEVVCNRLVLEIEKYFS